MRQAGVLAAAMLYALDHHIDRLADDHASAKDIATVVSAAAPDVVDPADVDTNIVVLDLAGTALTSGALVTRLKGEGILAGSVGSRYIRLVTHLDVTATECRRAAETTARLLSLAAPPG
jgi:threonine aldolase